MHRAPKTVLRRQLDRVVLSIIGAALLLYPLDWAIWRLRVAAGGGMGSVNVTTTTAATLKGNRFEVYGQVAAPVTCSRSLLPQAGSGACWWLSRHAQAVTQY